MSLPEPTKKPGGKATAKRPEPGTKGVRLGVRRRDKLRAWTAMVIAINLLGLGAVIALLEAPAGAWLSLTGLIGMVIGALWIGAKRRQAHQAVIAARNQRTNEADECASDETVTKTNDQTEHRLDN